MDNNPTIRIWRIQYTLLEPMFFASREIDTVYVCEPLLSSYGQPYALGWVNAPYRLVRRTIQTPRYPQDLEPLNDQPLYITPATPFGDVHYRMQRFNAMAETYWYRMSQGVVVSRIEDRPPTAKNVGAVNRPQQGHLRLVAPPTRFVSYVLAQELPQIAAYCRLGKFMSKALVEVKALGTAQPAEGTYTHDQLLNPADIDHQTTRFINFDLINVRPVPLLQHSTLEGPHWKLGTLCLPKPMRFTFPENKKTKKKKDPRKTRS